MGQDIDRDVGGPHISPEFYQTLFNAGTHTSGRLADMNNERVYAMFNDWIVKFHGL